MPQIGASHYKPTKVQTPKDAMLAAHQKIKIADVKKETDLLEICKMAWRPGNNYYKAYLPGDDRVQFFAFSDGSYMVCKKSDPNNIFHSYEWNVVFERCKQLTANALPNQEYDEGKAWIGKPMNAPAPSVQPQKSSTPSVGTAPGNYSLSPIEKNMLQILAQNKGGVTNGLAVSGYFIFEVPKDGTIFNVLSVGKVSISPTGKKYKVIHNYDGGKDEWDFPNWNQTYSFIAHNFGTLTQVTDHSVKTSVGATITPQIFSLSPSAELPPNATSQSAYKVHVGIDKPPTHTLRLTVEDEQTMTNAGFEVKMVGSDPWYIHKQTQDTVKFFPNDVAKIMFLKTNNKVVVSKKIEDALEWIKSKYTPSAGAISPIVAPLPSVKGSKAGAMYEKYLVNAGFAWDDMGGDYFNAASQSKIEIKPFPKSTFTDASGNTKTFHSLPELAAFLKTNADELKKK